MKKNPDVEKTVRDIRRHTRKLPKRKSGLSSKACAAKTVLPSFVAVRASIPMFITAGARNFWRRAKNVCRVTPFGKPLQMKSRPCVPRRLP